MPNTQTLNLMSKFIFTLIFFISFSLYATAQKDSTLIDSPDFYFSDGPKSDKDAYEELFKNTTNQAFWQLFQLKFKDNYSTPTLIKKSLTMVVDEYEMELYDARKAQTVFLKNYPKANELTPTFKKYIENNILWQYWYAVVAYPIWRGNAQTKHLVVTSLPSVMLENFDESKVNDETAMLCSPYRNFLTFYITYFNSKDKGFTKYSDMALASTDKLNYAKNHLSGKVMNYWLARYMLESCGITPGPKVKEMYLFLSAITSIENYAALVKAQCGEAMNKKEEPKKEEKKANKDPNALTLIDIKGNSFGLSDLKGKLVYIDVWASWCGPCRAEFPHSKALIEKLTDKQKKKITFLFISIDETEEAWKKAMEQLKLPGEHGRSEGGWTAKVVSYFNITGIPRYILIDKDGKIANFNAPRPSAPETLTEILKLIEE